MVIFSDVAGLSPIGFVRQLSGDIDKHKPILNCSGEQSFLRDCPLLPCRKLLRKLWQHNLLSLLLLA